jgi:predicted dehydrogenase
MPIRIGIIGTGFIAGQHARCLRQIDGVRIAAVASPTRTHAGDFCQAQDLPDAACFDNGLALIESGLVDAVYFCMPPFAHNGEVEAAAARGLHVFLEKPIALDSEKARRMVDVIARAGVLSQVGFMMRFSTAARQLKALLDTGAWGRPTLFTGRFWINSAGSDWWRDRSRSGGQIFEQVIHLYDLASFFCGPVRSAHGMLANLCHRDTPGYTIEDTSVGMVQFENGALASITGSNNAVPMHFFADYRVACERGTLEYRCTGQPWVRPDEATFYPLDGDPESVIQTADCFLEEDRHFIDCIQNQRQSLCPASAGLAAIELVERVIQSSHP